MQSIVYRIHWPSATRDYGRQWSEPVEPRSCPGSKRRPRAPPRVLCEIAAGQGSAGPAIGGRLRRRCVLCVVIGCLSPDCGAGVEQVSRFGRVSVFVEKVTSLDLERRNCSRKGTGRRWNLEGLRSAREDEDCAPAVRMNQRHATCLLHMASSSVGSQSVLLS